MPHGILIQLFWTALRSCQVSLYHEKISTIFLTFRNRLRLRMEFAANSITCANTRVKSNYKATKNICLWMTYTTLNEASKKLTLIWLWHWSLGYKKVLGTSPFNTRIDNSLFPVYVKSTPILFLILSNTVWLVCSIVKYFHESRCI